MRNDVSLSNILVIYRATAWMAVLAALGSLALVGVAMEGIASGRSDVSLYLVLAAAGCLLVTAIVGSGFYAMRRSLVLAERRRREALSALYRDALTGAYTRSYFVESLNGLIRASGSEPVGYLHLDLDHLKAINDGNGHAAGDRALVCLVDALNRVLPGSMIGRLGGDEFAVAVKGTNSKSVLTRLGWQILEELDRPQRVGHRDMRLSATIGIALAPEDGAHADELMSNADIALYKGKRSGRQTIVSFSRELLRDERHQRFVERELRAALLLDQLELHYQPVFDVEGTLRSYEALVRWHHPVRGMIPPDSFIPVAEQSDLIVKLGQWVLRRACRDLASLDTPALAINVSAAELRNPDFARRFAETIEEVGVEGRRLIVEITETAPLRKESVERLNLERLRALGARIAVDDFGAGHASLGYLRDLSFDIIKIDRSYVADIAENRTVSKIVEAICQIAETLEVTVVAEGVETQEQHEALRRCGCDAFQGYLLGRPQALSALAGDAARAKTAAA